MTSRVRWLSILALAHFLVPCALYAQAPHVDKKVGFQMRPPQGWGQIPVKVEEKWIVAKWQSDKKYEGKEAGIPPHVPLMRVIVFEKAKKEVTSEGGGIEVKEGASVSIGLEAPYLDYKDYLKRNFSDGGFFISAEEQGTSGGAPVTMIEVKVEKLTYTGKKRILAWVFKADFGEIAVEVDSLEDKYDKLKPIYLGALKTFKLIPRDPTLQSGDEIDTGAKVKITDGKEETPEEQKKRRMESQEKVFKKAIADLPKDWTHKRTAHYLILIHSKPQFADKVAAHAEAVRDWLDKNFGDVGKGYVQHGIIRICKDTDEENAFRKSSGDSYSSENREAVLSADSSSGKAYEFEYLGKALLQQYFHDKNEMLYRSMPPWLEIGLSEYLGTAQLKGRSLVFEPDQNEMVRMRDGRRGDKFLPVKELFSVTGKDLWTGENGMYIYAQCTSMVRFILGPGARQKKTAGLVRNYIADLLAVVEAEEAKEKEERKKKEGAGGPKTEEEEEAEFRKRRAESWDKKEKDLLGNVFQKSFGEWSDGDWNALQSAWEKTSK